ncbi:hypothetical protein [Nocardioides sp. GY 10127]|uniref:hypothetical protein n=1 Tax=Nocardioides sp. GY 10127 TaxID=2569762 RepID=UPI0010A7E508|nr:hypothetical protein [Nocardioides sp. GY 10127]TIC81673.1 hypothetical protein E8D37_10765 [Nocardioides sp. GY 10127]
MPALPGSARTLLGVLCVPALLLLGGLTGACAVLVHREWWMFGLSTAALVLTQLALPRGLSTRFVHTVGFVLVVWLGSRQQADGGFLVSADAHGLALYGQALLAILLAVATLPSPSRGSRSAPGSDDSAPGGVDDGTAGASLT